MIPSIDGAMIAILLLATVRGISIGLIREGFSLAALAAAVLAARFATPSAARWLEAWSGGRVVPELAPWVAGTAVAIVSIMLVAAVGRLIRRGAQLAGLAWADRLAGAALGAAEGVLVAALILTGALWTLGREHPALARSRSLETYDRLQELALRHADRLPDVAAPGRWNP